MQNLKIGTRVYHYSNMGKIGTVVEFHEGPPLPGNAWMTTEGTRTVQMFVTIEWDDQSKDMISVVGLMRADLD